ncbi:ABC transporter ATP-binding protein [Nitriliruptor alkaliphilus]|uniref:ABC transporter ATP-binding protein n=1 Tax=Nitriliruptor alkaliphilus TaxID=427918 RepID=UPI000698D693|nr:ATP-binding cassette domain-containing protein [Nitriliruptor alkaliphilus]
MSEALLEVEGLVRRFGGVTAIDHVSFRLERGGALGLIGPNGSGKTTLANLLTGFVRPDEGSVRFKGRSIAGWRPDRIVDLGLARSFQLVRPFYELPAYKNLIVPLRSPRARRLRGSGYGDADEMALQLLEDVGFERDSPIPRTPARNLPHGYLKRLELARCLALRPDLIILDELFSGMSLTEVAGMLPHVRRLREEGVTIIMIEHRIQELLSIVDEVLVLNFGAVIASGDPQVAMADEEVRRAYLGAEVDQDA